MLHTWSLSVEWQFYIFYPLFIMLLYKFLGEKFTKLALIIVAICSLALCIYISTFNTNFAFYLLPTRAWELIVGGLVFLFPYQLGNKKQFILQLIGISAIIVSIVSFSSGSLWPSYRAVLPVLGVALVIYTGYDSFITNNFIFQFLGKISYSIYLWHWPLVCFLIYAGLNDNIYFIVLAILCSLFLACISYYFVEQTTSKESIKWLDCIKYIAIIMMVILISYSSMIVNNYPEARDNKFQKLVSHINPYRGNCLIFTGNQFAECKIGDGPITAIVLGDSFADSVFSAIHYNSHGATLFWAYAGCPTLIDYKMDNINYDNYCAAFTEEKVNKLMDDESLNIPVIFIHYNNRYISDKTFSSYQEHYINTVCDIAKKHTMYIVKPIPVMEVNVPNQLIKNTLFNYSNKDISITLKHYYEQNYNMIAVMEQASKQCGIKLLDPIPYLCPDNQHCLGSSQGLPLYNDYVHLNERGNKALIPMFKQVFDRQKINK